MCLQHTAFLIQSCGAAKGRPYKMNLKTGNLGRLPLKLQLISDKGDKFQLVGLTLLHPLCYIFYKDIHRNWNFGDSPHESMLSCEH